MPQQSFTLTKFLLSPEEFFDGPTGRGLRRGGAGGSSFLFSIQAEAYIRQYLEASMFGFKSTGRTPTPFAEKEQRSPCNSYFVLLGTEECGGPHRRPQFRGHDDAALAPNMHPLDALLKADEQKLR